MKRGEILGAMLVAAIIVGAIASLGVAISGIPKREPVPSPHVGKVVASAGVEMGDAVVRFTDGTQMRVRRAGHRLFVD